MGSFSDYANLVTSSDIKLQFTPVNLRKNSRCRNHLTNLRSTQVLYIECRAYCCLLRLQVVNTDYDLPITAKIIKSEKEMLVTLDSLELKSVTL